MQKQRNKGIADINCKVVFEVNDGNIENAKSILSSMGGTTDNPNVKMSKLNNINEDALILNNLQD